MQSFIKSGRCCLVVLPCLVRRYSFLEYHMTSKIVRIQLLFCQGWSRRTAGRHENEDKWARKWWRCRQMAKSENVGRWAGTACQHCLISSASFGGRPSAISGRSPLLTFMRSSNAEIWQGVCTSSSTRGPRHRASLDICACTR